MPWGNDYHFVPTSSVPRMLSSEVAAKGKIPGSIVFFHPSTAPDFDLRLIGTAANLNYIKVDKVPVEGSLSHQKIAASLNKQMLGAIFIWVDELDSAICARLALAAAKKKMPVMLYCSTNTAVKQLNLCEKGRIEVRGVVLGPRVSVTFPKDSFPNLDEKQLVKTKKSINGKSEVTRTLSSIVRWY